MSQNKKKPPQNGCHKKKKKEGIAGIHETTHGLVRAVAAAARDSLSDDEDKADASDTSLLADQRRTREPGIGRGELRGAGADSKEYDSASPSAAASSRRRTDAITWLGAVLARGDNNFDRYFLFTPHGRSWAHQINKNKTSSLKQR